MICTKIFREWQQRVWHCTNRMWQQKFAIIQKNLKFYTFKSYVNHKPQTIFLPELHIQMTEKVHQWSILNFLTLRINQHRLEKLQSNRSVGLQR